RAARDGPRSSLVRAAAVASSHGKTIPHHAALARPAFPAPAAAAPALAKIGTESGPRPAFPAPAGSARGPEKTCNEDSPPAGPTGAGWERHRPVGRRADR